jgi:hypothetical protein
VRGYAHVIKEDLVNPRLLFMGTELGLWISVDGGASWSRYKGGDMPSVAVRDLAIHPRDHDLVIATHGRGIWIIDDMTPLRALTPETLTRGGAFVQTTPAVQQIGAFGGWANGDAEFIGPNPPGDAVITYYLQKRHIFGDMKLEVLDSAGKVLTTLPTSKRGGLSRVAWSMRMPPARIPPAATAAFGPGPRYMPGTYRVRLVDGDSTYATTLRVTRDARMKHTLADRQAQFELSVKLYNLLSEMTSVVERMNALRAALESRAAGLATSDSLASKLRGASVDLDTLRKKIVATKEGGMITGEERLRENLTELYGNVVSYEGRPSATQVERAAAITRELGDVSKEFDRWIARDLDPSTHCSLAEIFRGSSGPCPSPRWRRTPCQPVTPCHRASASRCRHSSSVARSTPTDHRATHAADRARRARPTTASEPHACGHRRRSTYCGARRTERAGHRGATPATPRSP